MYILPPRSWRYRHKNCCSKPTGWESALGVSAEYRDTEGHAKILLLPVQTSRILKLSNNDELHLHCNTWRFGMRVLWEVEG